MGTIHGVFWFSEEIMVLYGLDYEVKGFIVVYNMSANIREDYAIDQTFKKTRADVDSFLISNDPGSPQCPKNP